MFVLVRNGLPRVPAGRSASGTTMHGSLASRLGAKCDHQIPTVDTLQPPRTHLATQRGRISFSSQDGNMW